MLKIYLNYKYVKAKQDCIYENTSDLDYNVILHIEKKIMYVI